MHEHLKCAQHAWPSFVMFCHIFGKSGLPTFCFGRDWWWHETVNCGGVLLSNKLTTKLALLGRKQKINYATCKIIRQQLDKASNFPLCWHCTICLTGWVYVKIGMNETLIVSIMEAAPSNPSSRDAPICHILSEMSSMASWRLSILLSTIFCSLTPSVLSVKGFHPVLVEIFSLMISLCSLLVWEASIQNQLFAGP